MPRQDPNQPVSSSARMDATWSITAMASAGVVIEPHAVRFVAASCSRASSIVPTM